MSSESSSDPSSGVVPNSGTDSINMASSNALVPAQPLPQDLVSVSTGNSSHIPTPNQAKPTSVNGPSKQSTTATSALAERSPPERSLPSTVVEKSPPLALNSSLLPSVLASISKNTNSSSNSNSNLSNPSSNNAVNPVNATHSATHSATPSGPAGKSGDFKVPKKIILPENAIRPLLNTIESGSQTPTQAQNGAITRSSITELNKALKVKQKLINNTNNGAGTGNSFAINNNKEHQISHKSSDIVNIALQIGSTDQSTVSTPGDIELSVNPVTGTAAPVALNLVLPAVMHTPAESKSKDKKKTNNNATRADFFAAKLASAVDDVESSDSDETFVYEDNGAKASTSASQPILAPPTPIMASVASNGVALSSSPRMETVSSHGSMVNAPGIIPPLTQDETTLPASITFPPKNGGENPLLRSVKVYSKSAAVAGNPIPKTEASALKDNIVTISGKERPASQRLNSIYSMVHSLLQLPEENGGLMLADSPNGSVIVGTTHLANSDSLGASATTTSHVQNSGNHVNVSLFDKSSIHNPLSPSAGTSIHEGYTNDDEYSVVDVDDEGAGYLDLDPYEDADATLTKPQTQAPTVSSSINQSLGRNGSHANFHITSEDSNKGYKKKPKSSIASSSKLRSTTSKLFDKKGSQPRRYSIIPDDIDIEDFDDELIYYDNHIRFPYSNNSIGGGSAAGDRGGQMGENTPLLPQSGRLPHYRSLNLNSINEKRHVNKGKRFLSTTGPNNPSNTHSPNINDGNGNGISNGNHNPDIFPFPYPDNRQQPYYYDLEDYDDDSPPENDRLLDLNQKNALGNFAYPRLSSSNGHFMLPRKRSSTTQMRTRINCLKSLIITLVGIFAILSIGFIMGFVLATTKELNHVEITTVEHALVSQDELVFNVIVEAFNPGWFSIEVNDVELDIFAKSGYLPGDNDEFGQGKDTTVETVLLGSVVTFESPLVFKGGFFSREPLHDETEIKLISPGKNISVLSTTLMDEKKGNHTKPEPEPEPEPKPEPEPNPDNSKKWEIISKNPFDLIVRGVLKYKLPFTNTYKSVMVKKTAYVDPTDTS